MTSRRSDQNQHRLLRVSMNKAKVREHLDQAEQNVKKGEKLIEKHKIHKEHLNALREVQETMKETRDTVREELP